MQLVAYETQCARGIGQRCAKRHDFRSAVPWINPHEICRVEIVTEVICSSEKIFFSQRVIRHWNNLPDNTWSTPVQSTRSRIVWIASVWGNNSSRWTPRPTTTSTSISSCGLYTMADFDLFYHAECSIFVGFVLVDHNIERCQIRLKRPKPSVTRSARWAVPVSRQKGQTSPEGSIDGPWTCCQRIWDGGCE